MTDPDEWVRYHGLSYERTGWHAGPRRFKMSHNASKCFQSGAYLYYLLENVVCAEDCTLNEDLL
jgi:hypothetical protein